MRRDWLLESGADLAPDELIITDAAPVVATVVPAALAERQVVPMAIESRQLANPFLAPDLAVRAPTSNPRRRLDGWELMGPLYKAFETGAGGGAASMDLPPVPEFDRLSPKGLEIMPHQSRFLEAVRDGHRTFLLADEPGLGKTAESVLAASVADAYPLLAVVPNVVKMNWAREVERWTPHRRATVIHGDGEDIDAFADVFIVNYEILDRHLSWLSSLGLKGMVVDEAHFIKNLTSQRSQNVLALAARIREQVRDPLLLALTGTPLINDVEDFDAIWRFLGWTKGDKPGAELMARLDETGLTPADKAFYPEARDAVISMGIVRRKKKDVAADLPDKLIADLPVRARRRVRPLDPRRRARARRPARRAVPAHHRGRATAWSRPGEVDEDIVRLVARASSRSRSRRRRGRQRLHDGAQDRPGQGPARGGLRGAAAALGRQGRVLRQAHRRHGCRRGGTSRHADLRTVSIRGDQTTPARQIAIDAFNNDPAVGVAVCSLTAAGVGAQPAGGVERRAGRAVVDRGRADPGDRPRAPHRPGRARHGVAHHRGAHDRHEDRRADRLEAGARRARARRQDVEPQSSDSVQLSALMHLLRQALGAE